MKFEEYLRIVASKVGAQSAFSLSRDVRLEALENILVEKGIATKEELEAEVEKELGNMAEKISKMPPIPTESSKPADDKK